MKTKEQVKDEIKKLEIRWEKIWNGKDQFNKFEKIDIIRERIKALKWVLK